LLTHFRPRIPGHAAVGRGDLNAFAGVPENINLNVKGFNMSMINEGEIFARIHKFKIFRREGNLFIDLYEALLGEPAHKFVAVPNLVIQEADKKYFGVGDTKGAAIKDCLSKIKDVPIETIVPTDEPQEGTPNGPEADEKPKLSQSFWKLSHVFSRSGKK
jgi:hypothetical protein